MALYTCARITAIEAPTCNAPWCSDCVKLHNLFHCRVVGASVADEHDVYDVAVGVDEEVIAVGVEHNNPNAEGQLFYLSQELWWP